MIEEILNTKVRITLISIIDLNIKKIKIMFLHFRVGVKKLCSVFSLTALNKISTLILSLSLYSLRNI